MALFTIGIASAATAVLSARQRQDREPQLGKNPPP